jgi:hypothetical protein
LGERSPMISLQRYRIFDRQAAPSHKQHERTDPFSTVMAIVSAPVIVAIADSY